MANRWSWFNGWKTWANWVPGWNVWNWIDGFAHNEWRTPLGTLDYGNHEGTGTLADEIVNNFNGSSAVQEQGETNLALQHDAQAFNSAEAQKQRDWEQMMANTTYQRGMADMKAAGLNPWLMVQGSGAPVASGSSASSSASSVSQRPSGAQTLSNIVGSALSVAIIARILTKIMK